MGASSFRRGGGSVDVVFDLARGGRVAVKELNAMKAPSHHLEYEHANGSDHLAGPFAAVGVALGGAAVVVGAMLLVGMRELSIAQYIPDFATLQSLIIG